MFKTLTRLKLAKAIIKDHSFRKWFKLDDERMETNEHVSTFIDFASLAPFLLMSLFEYVHIFEYPHKLSC